MARVAWVTIERIARYIKWSDGANCDQVGNHSRLKSFLVVKMGQLYPNKCAHLHASKAKVLFTEQKRPGFIHATRGRCVRGAINWFFLPCAKYPGMGTTYIILHISTGLHAPDQ